MQAGFAFLSSEVPVSFVTDPGKVPKLGIVSPALSSLLHASRLPCFLPSGQSVQSPGQDGGERDGDDGVRGSLQQHVPARGNEEVQAGTHGNCNGTVGNPSQRQGQGNQGQGQQQGSPATAQQDFAADGIIGWTGHGVSCSEQLRPLAGLECQLLGALETGPQLSSSSVGAAPSNGHHKPVVDEARAGIDGSPGGHWIREAPRGGLQGNTQASVPIQQGVLRGQVEAAPDEAHFEANSALDCLSHPKGEDWRDSRRSQT